METQNLIPMGLQNVMYATDEMLDFVRIMSKHIISLSFFFQILHACMNLTTNEMFNYKRYPYLRDKRGKYLNPFSRGPLLNLVEFFVCTPSDSDEQLLLIEDSP